MRTLERPVPTIPQLAMAGIDTSAALRRHLHPVLFDRVAWYLVSQENFDRELAVTAADSSWAFLELLARPRTSTTRLAPPTLVDKAWHATILFTRQYAELCAALGVRGIIHHEPFDDPAPYGSRGAAAAARALHDAGIPFDQQFWDSAGTDECKSPCDCPDDRPWR